ncbi:TPA: hypothetical protein RQJ16_001890 [Campylobacter fetus subsp. venerealis]|nr:hypothetical protein [Campylobacter fetus subsp. venerealis]HDX6296023.1 hypothetical protein [Campylobacter fetus subsp. venerealis]HDX6309313.1 hypothetical protein [Campylobacter fetus subsp. venerealis]HDX8136043.1 hypothetical protein [Campylobacter fetus subsp. venerealis]
MDFKRTTNSTANLDEFINGAETQNESIKKNETYLYVHAGFSKEIGDRIKQKYSKMSLTKWIEQALIQEIPHIKENVLPFIYQKAEWHNMTIQNFVKFKMGLLDTPQSKTPKDKKENIRYIGIKTQNKENKEAIKRNAENLGLSVRSYSKIKILATYELKDMFTFEELMQFKAEAMNYDLELDEYITMRIKG